MAATATRVFDLTNLSKEIDNNSDSVPGLNKWSRDKLVETATSDTSKCCDTPAPVLKREASRNPCLVFLQFANEVGDDHSCARLNGQKPLARVESIQSDFQSPKTSHEGSRIADLFTILNHQISSDQTNRPRLLPLSNYNLISNHSLLPKHFFPIPQPLRP